MGLAIGATTSYPISPSLSFDPEILFIQKGTQVNQSINQVNFTSRYSNDYLELPILFKARTSDSIRVYAGPYVSMLLNSNLKISALNSSVEGNTNTLYQSLDYGVVVGTAYTADRWTLDFRWQQGVSNISKPNSAVNVGGIHVGTSSKDEDIKNSSITFSAAVQI